MSNEHFVKKWDFNPNNQANPISQAKKQKEIVLKNWDYGQLPKVVLKASSKGQNSYSDDIACQLLTPAVKHELMFEFAKIEFVLSEYLYYDALESPEYENTMKGKAARQLMNSYKLKLASL